MWVDDDDVEAALKTGNEQPLKESGVRYCLSKDRRYCVLIRVHDAWYTEGDGWRDGNFPPRAGRKGRRALNFYKRQLGDDEGLWFKTLVPESVEIREMQASDEGHLDAVLGTSSRRLTFSRIDDLMWDVITGKGQEEHEIEAAFEMLWD